MSRVWKPKTGLRFLVMRGEATMRMALYDDLSPRPSITVSMDTSLNPFPSDGLERWASTLARFASVALALTSELARLDTRLLSTAMGSLTVPLAGGLAEESAFDILISDLDADNLVSILYKDDTRLFDAVVNARTVPGADRTLTGPGADREASMLAMQHIAICAWENLMALQKCVYEGRCDCCGLQL